MHFPSKLIAVYGATGHTGQFVVREAQRRGLAVVVVGRSAAKLGEAFGSVADRRVAVLEDPVSLEQAFEGCALVINCAGPFLDTAAPVAQAALSAQCHYIDVTAEQASAQATFADFDAAARAAHRVVIPAAGFYGGLADLLVSALAAAQDIDEVTVAIALDRWWPTLGTRKTGARNTAPRMVVTKRVLAPLLPSAPAPNWAFSPPLGNQPMLELPFSEVITLNQHLKVGAIRSLFNRSALEDIRDPATPPPTPVDASGRSAQRFEMQVQLVQQGAVKTASAQGQDIYAVTAPIVIEAAQRLLAPGYQHCGALALADALDPVEMLHALNGRTFDVLTDGLSSHRPAASGNATGQATVLHK